MGLSEVSNILWQERHLQEIRLSPLSCGGKSPSA